jgi:hypothetical protein
MSFKRFDSEDFLVSIDAVTAGAFTGNSSEMTTITTSSTQENGASGLYFLEVLRETGGEPQFSIAFGDVNGSGSAPFDSGIQGKSPTSTVYGQFRNIILGDESSSLSFGEITPPLPSQSFFAITFNRARYKGSLFPGTFNLGLSGSQFIQLTDNSKDVTTIQFNEAGRVFQLVSGSDGTATGPSSGLSPAGKGSYGLFLPDIGTCILNTDALNQTAANGGVIGSDNFFGALAFGSVASENNRKLHCTISQSIAKDAASGASDNTSSGSLILNSLDNVASDYVFVRARNGEFNYSENPSFISGSTGEVLYDAFINAPQTFITTVGLYNDSNELVATAKLSKPLKKDFTKEALIRVKLDF